MIAIWWVLTTILATAINQVVYGLRKDAREAMGPAQILLGNIDPVRALRNSDPEAVTAKIAHTKTPTPKTGTSKKRRLQNLPTLCLRLVNVGSGVPVCFG